MTFKDWVTLVFSFVALVVSVSTALFNVILQQDDIRVVIGDSPQLERSENSELHLSGDQELTFINSGNRAAAITAMAGLAWRAGDTPTGAGNCKPENVTTIGIGFDTKPFVLKPGELLVIKAAVTEGIPWVRHKEEGTLHVPKELFESKLADTYLVCLSLNIVTPDSYSEQWRKPVYKYVVDEEGYPEQSLLFEKEKPVVILHRMSTVFARFMRQP